MDNHWRTPNDCEKLAEMTDSEVLEVWYTIRFVRIGRTPSGWRKSVEGELIDRGFDPMKQSR